MNAPSAARALLTTALLLIVAVAHLELSGCESRGRLLSDGPAEHSPLDLAPGEPGGDLGWRDRGAESRPPAPNGQPCNQDGQCQSSHCSDGVCCAVACSGPCNQCNEPGLEGICTVGAQGASPPPGKTCAASPVSSCGLDGTCDGRGSCRHWPAATVCKPAQCEASAHPTRLSLAWHCDGAGGCVPLGEIDCDPYGCDVAHQQCFSVCSTTVPMSCGADASCDSSGRCDGALPPLGSSCSSNASCASGQCADGVCCESDCIMACASCALSGSAGRCTAIAAGLPPKAGKSCPVDPLKPCGNDGKCDGHQSCEPAPVGTPCGAAVCQDGAVNLHLCNGDSSDPACTTKEISCGGFLCKPGGPSCYESCTSVAQCQEGHSCAAGRCVQCVSGSDCEPGEICVDFKCI